MTRQERWKRDSEVEQMAAEFLDKHFYPMFAKADVQRYKDTYHQFGGIDVSINTTNFDEKCKYQGLLNKVLDTVGFECSMVNKAGNLQTGWFLNSSLSTDYYAFIGLSATVDDDRQLTATAQISAADVLWVKKQDVVDYIEGFNGYYGKVTTAMISADTDELRRHGDNDYVDIFGNHILDAKGKARHRYPHNMYWLTYSTKIDEKPINLVIPRSALENLPHSRHFIVTREDGIKRV